MREKLPSGSYCQVMAELIIELLPFLTPVLSRFGPVPDMNPLQLSPNSIVDFDSSWKIQSVIILRMYKHLSVHMPASQPVFLPARLGCILASQVCLVRM